MSGTVNISRDIWHDVAFKDQPFTEREAFIWIIMEASYKAREKRVGNITVNLERGQLATSIRFMCEAWSWSKSTVDRFLKRLEKRDMIGTASGTGINVITVCKYNDYQNMPNGSGTAKNENRDTTGTAAGQQRDKPNKGLIPDASHKGLGKPKPCVIDAQNGFDDFWKIWPSKKCKDAARKAWRKMPIESKRLAFSAVRDGWFERWQSESPQANPIHASSFLNGKRWEDEPQQPQLKALNGGSNHGQPASKSAKRIQAWTQGARGTFSSS